MNNYDFLNLSPVEFELLVRDLFQAKLQITIEGFAEGVDKGIDLRFNSEDLGLGVIQCKRYRNFSDVYKSLKGEVPKVLALNPDRYIVATSVNLTPLRKEKIKTLFNGLIQNDTDILGKNDLNNLLATYPEIENRHFKLWLTSTNILQRILKSNVYNQTRFEENEIRNLSKVYVPNPSFDDALKILEQNRYVIISGIPGIGKSTLARMLIYHFLSKNFAELIYITDSNAAWEFVSNSKNQIFFFDDFLGRIAYDNKQGISENSLLLKFIELISSSKNIFLILTTRENILNKAVENSENKDIHILNRGKIVLDLSLYTPLIKGKILYNHLFFSEIPKKYINNLFKNRFYLDLVNHKNFNPRIIETLIAERIWERCEPDAIQATFMASFDEPFRIWKYTFENQISDLSRCFLLEMAICETPILLNDLESALKSFVADKGDQYGIILNPVLFRQTIRELHNSFIDTVNDSEGNIALDFKNPSVHDFLIGYLIENESLLLDFIDSPIYLNQLTSSIKYFNLANKNCKQSIYTINVICQKIIVNFSSLKQLILHKHHGDELPFVWGYFPHGPFTKLDAAFREDIFNNHAFPEYKKFIIETFQNLLNNFNDNYHYMDSSSFLSLFKACKDYVAVNEIEIVKVFTNSILLLSNLITLKSFAECFPIGFKKVLPDNDSFDKLFRKAFYGELKLSTYSSTTQAYILLMLKMIEKAFNIKMIERYPFVQDLASPINFEEFSLEEGLNTISKHAKETEYYTKILDDFFGEMFPPNREFSID